MAETKQAPEAGDTGEHALVPEPLTPEQIEDLKVRASKADENWDRLLRTKADMDNYKKRAAREKEDAIRYANESLFKKLAPVLDNLDMAFASAAQNASGGVQSLQAGVTMIVQQLRRVLQEAGLEEVDAAVGKPFDPNSARSPHPAGIRRRVPKARSSSSCARATNCVTASSAPPA